MPGMMSWQKTRSIERHAMKPKKEKALTWEEWFNELEVIHTKFGLLCPPALDTSFQGFQDSLIIQHFETRRFVDEAVAILSRGDGTPLPDLDAWSRYFLSWRCFHAMHICRALVLLLTRESLDRPYELVLCWLLVDCWNDRGWDDLQEKIYTVWLDETGHRGPTVATPFLDIQGNGMFAA